MRAWLLLAAMIIAPLAAAGSAEDPEIEDPAGDHTTGVNQDPFSGWDILYAFVSTSDCGADHLRIEVGLFNIFTLDAGSLPGATKSIAFNADGAAWTGIFRNVPNQDNLAENFFSVTDAAGTETEVTGQVVNDGGEYVAWCIPFALLGIGPGSIIDGLYVTSDSPVVGQHDIAPDGAPTETGRAFTLPGGDVEANITVALVDAGPFAIEAGGELLFNVVITNMAPTNDTVTMLGFVDAAFWGVGVNPGTVDLDTGASFEVEITVAADIDAEPADHVVLEYQSSLGATGNLTVPFTFTAADVSPTPSPSSNDDDSADTPSLPGAVVMVLLAVVAARRR